MGQPDMPPDRKGPQPQSVTGDRNVLIRNNKSDLEHIDNYLLYGLIHPEDLRRKVIELVESGTPPERILDKAHFWEESLMWMTWSTAGSAIVVALLADRNDIGWDTLLAWMGGSGAIFLILVIYNYVKSRSLPKDEYQILQKAMEGKFQLMKELRGNGSHRNEADLILKATHTCSEIIRYREYMDVNNDDLDLKTELMSISRQIATVASMRDSASRLRSMNSGIDSKEADRSVAISLERIEEMWLSSGKRVASLVNHLDTLKGFESKMVDIRSLKRASDLEMSVSMVYGSWLEESRAGDKRVGDATDELEASTESIAEFIEEMNKKLPPSE